MKHFLFTVKQHRPNTEGHVKYTISLWNVVKNVPVYFGSRPFFYKSTEAALAELAYELKAIPAKKGEKFKTAVRIENEGIATFHYIPTS